MKKEGNNEKALYLHKKPVILAAISCLTMVVVILVTLADSSAEQQYLIPSWVKNTAKWWGYSQIGDSDFINGLQWLIQNKIMVIPQGNATGESSGGQIPSWVKNTAKWWGDGQIGDSDFVHGIQYLIDARIINIKNPAAQTTSSQSAGLDRFGIKEMYPTISGGREWFSNWFTTPHTISSGDFDPYDPQFQARGDGYTHVSGDGTAYMSGFAPRMYVLDPTLQKLWKNVEITFYGKRVSDSNIVSYQGLTSGIGGSHDDVKYPDVCTDSTGYPNTAYSGRILYDGRVDYEKEVLYHRGDATSYSKGTHPTIKSAFENLDTPVDPSSKYHSMPFNTWIGYKFIVQDTSIGVHMETWMDMTNGTNGGSWTKMNIFDDNGGWSVIHWYKGYSPANWPCANVPMDYVMNHATPYVHIRADSVKEVDYKDFSVREINPLP